jgi:hypothetical protein
MDLTIENLRLKGLIALRNRENERLNIQLLETITEYNTFKETIGLVKKHFPKTEIT